MNRIPRDAVFAFRLPKIVHNKAIEYCTANNISLSDLVCAALVEKLGGKYIPEQLIFDKGVKK